MRDFPLHLSHPDVHGSLPLVLGVTGHRDLRAEDVPQLEELLRSIINDFRSHYPTTPLIMLTSLAEGADRLGARVGLECGVKILAPLPMPIDIYEQDFTTETSRAEFHELLQQCERSYVVPFSEGVTRENLNETYNRNSQYGQVGGYIARYSQILIAFWNGKHLDSQGGTSNVIRYKLEGLAELEEAEQNPLDPPETGPVYHIVSPRKSEETTLGDPFTIKTYFPKGYESEEAAEKHHRRIYEQIETFNRDAGQLEGKLTKERAQSKKYLFPEEHYNTLSPALRSTIDNFTLADSLASYFQHYTIRAFRGLFLLVLTAATFFDVYAHLIHDERSILIGYLISLLAAFLWYEYAKHKHFQTKYLDYRSLAEGLRVQFYWQFSGVRNSASEFYIRKQKSELDWIRFALRTLAISADEESLSSEEHTSESRMKRLEVTQKYWVEDQAKYYKKALHRDHIQLHKLERAINYIFFIGVALAALQLFIEPNHYLIVAIGLAPIVAALIGSYIEKNGLIGHIKQYERMSTLFARANNLILGFVEQGKRKEASLYIFELGKESLAENGDWLLHHRERPLEVPKG